MNKQASNISSEQFLSGGGEMGELIRTKDWSKTVIGNPETWPQSLRTTLSIILHSKFPMFLFWGPDLICFYNDAYRPSLGKEGKHPAILGSRGEDYWQEIWPVIKPLIDQVLAGGEASWSEDQFIPIYRNSKLEDVYWTFSYSAVNDESGKPAGVFVTCNETTDKVITRHKLEESKDQLEFAIEAAELGTWDYNPFTNKFSANERLKGWFGFPAADELDLSLALDAIADKDRQRIAEAIQTVLQFSSGGHFDNEFTLINYITQKEIIVRGIGKAWFDKDKLAYRFTGTLHNVTEQVIAQRKIEESERSLRLMILQAPVAMCVFKGENHVVEIANEKMLELWGRPAADVMDKPIFEGLPEAKGQGLETIVDNVFKTGEKFQANERPVNLPRKDTIETTYINFVYEPLKNADGTISGILAIANDVTFQVIARKKIEESEEQLRIALEGGELGTFDFYPETDNLVWSVKTKEFFGLPPDAAVDYTTYIQAIHPQDRDTSRAIARQQVNLKDDGLYELEYRSIGIRDGKLRWLRSKGKATYNAEGNPIRYTGVIHDITKRKLAEEALKESEEKFRTMAESSDILIGINDESVNAVYFNKVWTTLTGRPLEDLLNLGWADLLHPDDRQPFLNKFFTAYEKKESYEGEFRILNKEGTYSWLYAKVQVRLYPDGSYAGHISSCIDITERKRVEEEIKQKEQHIRSLVQSAPFPIGVYVGREMRIELVNDSILLSWGRSKDVTGKLYAEVLPELKDQGLFEQLDDVFTTGIAFHAKNQPLDLVVDGKLQTYYYNYSFTPLYDEAGKIYGILNTGADVTDLNIATQKTEQSDKRFRNTVHQAPIGITILRGSEFIVEMANDAYLKLVDKMEAGFVGKSLFDSLPEVKESVQPLLNEVLATGIPFHGIEYPIPVNRYGKFEISYFDFLYSPLREEDGNISGILVTVTDVSASVKAKHILAESEKQFRNLVTQSPIAMAIFQGEDYIIEMANEVMIEKLWRKEKNEVLGKKLLDVFPEIKEQKYAELLYTVYHSAVIHNEKESLAFVNGNDGLRKFYFDYEYRPLFQTDGSVFGIMITVNDVTEKVESRKKIEENEERLKMSIQMTNLGTWEFNPVSGELNWSEECKAIYALPENEQVDFQVFSKQIHPLDKDFVEAAIQEAMNPSGEGKYDIVYRILRFNDNSTRWIRAKGKVYFNTVNKAERFIGTVVDITDQKLAQGILEESEQRSRLAIDAANMGTFDWDLVTQEFISSPRLNDIFGFPGQPNITHQHLINAFHPEDKPARDKAVQEATGNGSLRYEARITWPDKSIRWVRVFGKVIYNNQQQPIKIYGTVVDITEEKRNLKALEENTARLNIAIDASELGMWELYLNDQDKEAHYSDRYLEIMGYKERIEMTHEQLVQHLHPDDLSIREDAFKKAFSTGILHYESRIIWNDQSLHWIEGRGKVFYNEKNQPSHLMGTLRDITEEKYYQQELEEREQKFRLLADSMPQLVWTGNEEGDLNYFNQSVYKYSGLTPDEIKKEGWLQIVHPDDREENINKWMQSIKTGNDFLFEHRFRRFDGTYRWQLSRAIPQKDAAGNIQMWVGTSTDIEEQKMFTNELEHQVLERTKELEQKNKELERMNTELQSFAFVSSHDLQEPLRKIQTFGSLIHQKEQQTLSENGKDYLRRMQDAAKRMQTLIEDLLAYSRTNSNEHKPEKINISSILKQVESDLAEEIEEKKATIEAADLSEVKIIGFQFRQLLTNLISNSLKFTIPGINPYIKITAEIKDGDQLNNETLLPFQPYYHLTVSDNGIGFEPEYKDRIFEIFQRLHGKDKYKGTGIGLAIVKKIVNNHNGIIIATGQLNNGAIFDIYIPIEKE